MLPAGGVRPERCIVSRAIVRPRANSRVEAAGGVTPERIKANGRVERRIPLHAGGGVVLERPCANGRVAGALGVLKERLPAKGRVAAAFCVL